MKFNELQGFIKDSLKYTNESLFQYDIGYVISIKEQIVVANGLLNVQLDEVVIFANGDRGVVNKIDANSISILLLKENTNIHEGMEIKRSEQFLMIKVSNELLGKALDAYGNPLDGTIINNYEELYIDSDAQPMIKRAPINEQLVTGIKCIDFLTPVGYGQRELIVGSRGTGKTTIASDIMISLKDNPKDICIYVSIGQRKSSIACLGALLNAQGVNNIITIVAASSNTASERFYAPYTAMTIGEYFMKQGKNVVVFFDDLNQHAIAHREICLTMKRSVGREAYPGDIFYIHAKLLERSCLLSDHEGGGSISAFPMMEIFGDDISSYITTNVISIVDGQIVLSKDLFAANCRPAMKVGLSLSRVGGSAQSSFLKKLCGSLRLELSQHDEYEQLFKLSSDITPAMEKLLARGNLLKKILFQKAGEPVPMWKQLLLLYAFKKDYIVDEYTLNKINEIYSVDSKDDILDGNEVYIKSLLENKLNVKN